MYMYVSHMYMYLRYIGPVGPMYLRYIITFVLQNWTLFRGSYRGDDLGYPPKAVSPPPQKFHDQNEILQLVHVC